MATTPQNAISLVGNPVENVGEDPAALVPRSAPRSNSTALDQKKVTNPLYRSSLAGNGRRPSAIDSVMAQAFLDFRTQFLGDKQPWEWAMERQNWIKYIYYLNAILLIPTCLILGKEAHDLQTGGELGRQAKLALGVSVAVLLMSVLGVYGARQVRKDLDDRKMVTPLVGAPGAPQAHGGPGDFVETYGQRVLEVYFYICIALVFVSVFHMSVAAREGRIVTGLLALVTAVLILFGAYCAAKIVTWFEILQGFMEWSNAIFFCAGIALTGVTGFLLKYMDTLPAQVEQPPEKVWITVQFVVGIFMTFVAFQGFLAAYKESRRQAHFYMSAVVVLILMIGVTQFQLGEFDSERYMGEHCSSTMQFLPEEWAKSFIGCTKYYGTAERWSDESDQWQTFSNTAGALDSLDCIDKEDEVYAWEHNRNFPEANSGPDGPVEYWGCVRTGKDFTPAGANCTGVSTSLCVYSCCDKLADFIGGVTGAMRTISIGSIVMLLLGLVSARYMSSKFTDNGTKVMLHHNSRLVAFMMLFLLLISCISIPVGDRSIGEPEPIATEEGEGNFNATTATSATGDPLTALNPNSSATLASSNQTVAVINVTTVGKGSAALRNCELSAWGSFSPCNVTCPDRSSGQSSFKSRSRTILRNRTADGECPALVEELPCAPQDDQCSVNCAVSDWGSFSSCSASCGKGVQTRTRDVTTAAAFAGTPCPALRQQQRCFGTKCPVDCVLSSWGGFSACDEACGDGTKTRTRSVVVEPKHGGKDCDNTVEETSCTGTLCKKDCTLSPWGSYSACSVACGQGAEVRNRTITQQAANGGNSCDSEPLQEVRTCDAASPCAPPPAPVAKNCAATAWGSYGDCSKTCGDGIQFRTRSVTQEAINGGSLTDCTPLIENQTCNTLVPCPVDCEVSQWGSFASCTKTCGGGTRTRTRSVTTAKVGGGANCPLLSESPPCATTPCPIDCVVSDWAQCSKSCGGGNRNRTVTTRTDHGGLECPTLSQACSTNPCPVHCAFGNWGDFGDCTASCGGGRRTRTRAVAVAAANGGDPCSGASQEVEACETQVCNVDCAVSQWGAFAACSKTCGSGTHNRTRSVTAAAQGGGTPCATFSLSETQPCTDGPCPVDCEFSAWGSFGDCSATCGNAGTQKRTRAIATPAAHGGTECVGPKEESQDCNRGVVCPVDCEVSQWGSFSSCSKTCGGGTRTRTRTVTTAKVGGGANCPSLSESPPCATRLCPVDCVVSAWGVFDPCSVTCGAGTQARVRTITTPPANGGAPCASPLAETQPCSPGKCKVDCAVTNWGQFGACSATCCTDGSACGKQSRRRTVAVLPVAGGASCPALVEGQACTAAACPVDCVLSDWGSFGVCGGCECESACGKGTHTRYRTIVTQAQFGGVACRDTDKPKSGARRLSSKKLFQLANLRETQPCDAQQKCPINCVVSQWSSFSACNGGGCGKAPEGDKVRTRTITAAPQHGGTPCPELEDIEKCIRDCADCVVSAFGSFGACKKAKCGSGLKGERVRTRSITTAPKGGGAACGRLEETQECGPVAEPCIDRVVVVQHTLEPFCTDCHPLTDGPCQHNGASDNSCFQKQELFGKLVCPAGTTECSGDTTIVDTIATAGACKPYVNAFALTTSGAKTLAECDLKVDINISGGGSIKTDSQLASKTAASWSGTETQIGAALGNFQYCPPCTAPVGTRVKISFSVSTATSHCELVGLAAPLAFNLELAQPPLTQTLTGRLDPVPSKPADVTALVYSGSESNCNPKTTTNAKDGTYELTFGYPQAKHQSKIQLEYNASGETRYAEAELGAAVAVEQERQYELRNGGCVDRVSGSVQPLSKCAASCAQAPPSIASIDEQADYNVTAATYCDCSGGGSRPPLCAGSEGSCVGCTQGTEGECQSPTDGTCESTDEQTGECPATHPTRCAGIPCRCDQDASGVASKAVALVNAEVLPAVDIVTKVVNAAATTHVVFGTVVDALCKSGIAAAEIKLRGNKADGTEIVKQITTAADGTFEITGLVGDVLYEVSASGPTGAQHATAVHEGVSAVASANKLDADPLLFALAPAVPAGQVTIVLQWGRGQKALDRANANRTKATRLRKGDLDLMVGFDAVKVKNCKNCYPGTSGPCQQSNGVCWNFLPGNENACPVGTTQCGASGKQTKRTCWIFDRKPKCGQVHGGELLRRDPAPLRASPKAKPVSKNDAKKAFNSGIKSAPTPVPVQQKCGAVHPDAELYGVEMVTLNELLATTYTVVVKNYRVRQLATEESLATVTAYTPGDNHYVSRVAAPCFDGICTAYSSPYPEAGKQLESTANRKMAQFSRMLCWDGGASASAAQPTFRRCQQYMSRGAWRTARTFQRCPPAPTDRCPAGSAGGWLCSSNLRGGAFNCPSGIASLEKCGRRKICKPCCRICRVGKACGNSCIARSRQCLKAEEGCACNESDLGKPRFQGKSWADVKDIMCADQPAPSRRRRRASKQA